LLGFEVAKQLQQVPLERVRAALAVAVVVLPDVPVEYGLVYGGEVLLELIGAEPGVEVPRRVDVGVDGRLLVVALVAVRRGPQVVVELGDRGLPVAEVLDLRGWVRCRALARLAMRTVPRAGSLAPGWAPYGYGRR
jgi:hypothetical protein